MKQVLESRARVLLDRVPGAPVTALYLQIGAGAADERPGEHGAAHFLEHMAFKGAPGLGVGEIAAAFEAMGGDVNAYTNHDRTVFHATVPTPRWPEALRILAGMTLGLEIADGEVTLEREVILDELRGVVDDPGGMLADAVAARCYTVHPYGRPVIGTLESVGGMTPDTLRAFHARHYQPANMILAVAGDVEPDALLEQARALLGGPERPQVQERWPAEPPQTEPREVVLTGRFEEPMVELALPGVAADHEDALALDVLLTALINGNGSIIGADLQVKRGLVSELWASCEACEDGGRVLIGCSPRRGKVREAVLALGAALRRAALEGVGVHALERARARTLADRLFELETVDGRAHSWLWFETVTGDPEAEAAVRAELQALTVADMRRVARTYLRFEACTLGLSLPETEPVGVGLAAALARTPMPEPAPRPAIWRRVLSNGATLVVEPMERSSVAAIQVATLGGQLVERPSTAGVSELWSRVVAYDGMGAADLDRWLDLRGATFEGIAGLSTLGLRCELPAQHIDDGLYLISDLISFPYFNEDDVERTLEDLRDEARSLSDASGRWARQVGDRALFGPHPYGLPGGGTLESLDRLGLRAAERLHRRYMGASGLVVTVVGAVEPEAVLERLEHGLGDLPEGDVRLPRRPQARPPRRLQRVTLAADREQAHVLLLWPGLRVVDPDAEALELAATVLGGQSGRLFLELRDRRGLAYEVSASSDEGWDPGSFSAWMSVDPARVMEGLSGMRQVITRLAEEGPSAEELERAKASTLGALAMGRQRASDRAVELAYWERYGWDARQVRAHVERAYAQVTQEQLRLALAARLAASPGVEVLVTPAAARKAAG